MWQEAEFWAAVTVVVRSGSGACSGCSLQCCNGCHVAPWLNVCHVAQCVPDQAPGLGTQAHSLSDGLGAQEHRLWCSVAVIVRWRRSRTVHCTQPHSHSHTDTDTPPRRRAPSPPGPGHRAAFSERRRAPATSDAVAHLSPTGSVVSTGSSGMSAAVLAVSSALDQVQGLEAQGRRSGSGWSTVLHHVRGGGSGGSRWQWQ